MIHDFPGPNFYYDQEDLLRRRAERDGFAFTIFRPEAVCGVAIGNPMNLLTAIAVYANLCKHKHRRNGCLALGRRGDQDPHSWHADVTFGHCDAAP